MAKWPKDTQEARNAFYGDPAKGEIEQQLVDVYPPFRMYYDGQPVSRIRFHRKAAQALQAALEEIWQAYNYDQSAIDRDGVSVYAGAYNHRLVRGSTSKWSNHAYGTAIDINPAKNAMGTKGNMPQVVIDAFTRQGAMWGGWYSGRTDPMHFEFVDNGGRKPRYPAPGSATAATTVKAPSMDASKQVQNIQRKLIDLGYYEVGEADGLLGGKTKGAITAFLNDNGLATYTTLDTLEDYIERSWKNGFHRPVAPARAYATADDIKDRTKIVKQNQWSRFWAKLMAVPSTIGTAVWGATAAVPQANSLVAPYRDIIGSYLSEVPGWFWLLVVALIGFLIWHSTSRTEAETVADYQRGRLN